MEDKQFIPAGVKIISILHYIGAILGFIGGIFLIFSFLGFDFIIKIVGGFLLIYGIFSFFIARGLWKGKNWAKILAIIFSISGFLISLGNLIFKVGEINRLGTIPSLVIYGFIAGYLLFSNKAKEFFSENRKSYKF